MTKQNEENTKIEFVYNVILISKGKNKQEENFNISKYNKYGSTIIPANEIENMKELGMLSNLTTNAFQNIL